MRTARIIFLLWTAGVAARAQIAVTAVTDAASFGPRVSPGSLATIFGNGLAATTAQASGFPLPTKLGGTTVLVNDSPAPLVYVSGSQINFQVPSGLQAGTANLYVSVVSGIQSKRFSFTVASAAPGIFQDSSNHAVAQNTDYSTNSTGNPAASGSVVIVYLTGQGPVDNAVADGSATPNAPLSTATASASATIGGADAPVQFLGLTPGFAGLAQANLQVPSLPTGDYPLVLTVGGYVSASATISVSGTGTPPPQILKLVGQTSFVNSADSMPAVLGNITYVCGANQIQVVDTSNASQPAYVGEFGDADLNGNGGRCALATPLGLQPILVDIVGPGNTPSFVVYNVSTPASPFKVGQLPLQYTYLADLSFIGTTGFSSTSWYEFDGASNITAQHGDVLAYDFSTPTLPLFVSALVPNPAQPASNNLNLKPNALALIQNANYPNTVYVASTTATGNNTSGSAALDVVDVSNPSNMLGVRQVTVANVAIFLGFAYDHRLLLMAGNTQNHRNPGIPDFNIAGNLTLTTMDITSVQNPVPIATLVTKIPSGGTFAVQPLGNSIFAVATDPPASDPGGPGSLLLVDARDPKNLALYPFVTQFGLSGMQSSNGYLIVPNLNGLNVYQTQLPQ